MPRQSAHLASVWRPPVGAVNLRRWTTRCLPACSPVYRSHGRERAVNQQRHAYQGRFDFSIRFRRDQIYARLSLREHSPVICVKPSVPATCRHTGGTLGSWKVSPAKRFVEREADLKSSSKSTLPNCRLSDQKRRSKSKGSNPTASRMPNVPRIA